MTARQSFIDSHPSIHASMEDFEAREFSPTMPDIPSQHSGFRSHMGSEYSETSSRRSHSPPRWRTAGSGWFKHQPSLSPGRGGFASREISPQYHSAEEDEGDLTTYRSAMRVPLPASPTKGRSPSNSPEPSTGAGAGEQDKGGGYKEAHDEPESRMQTPTESNYIRFSGSVAVQQRTDAIEAVIFYFRKFYHHMTKSKYNTLFYALSTIICYWLIASLFRTPVDGPVPDLVKVAGLAESFEPVIWYSEAGNEQIAELQATGVAVWDLSESVRNTNMTSSPMIVNQLGSLSDSLKDLSMEMTTFFAGLEGDVDSILGVMEWAGRELHVLSQSPQSTISSVFSNAQNLLVSTGVMSADNHLVQDLVGQTSQQRNRDSLKRIFHEFLNVMEESITNELDYSLKLVSYFETIDAQFLNLHRTVIREQDQQERIQGDFLSSMWTRVVGVNASKLRKYEKNLDLLKSVRDRTVRNKHTLENHRQRLRQMKANLDHLRGRLASPLVRNTNSSTLTVDEQIRGLEGTYAQLKGVRESQKRKKLESLYASRDKRDELHQVHSRFRREVEGRTR